MSVPLWIDESATEHDAVSKQLVGLLSELLNMKEDIRAELELIDGIDLAEVPWPEQFKARVFWSSFVLDLRQAAGLKCLVSHMAAKFPPKKEAFGYFLVLKAARSTTWYEVANPLEAQFVGSGAAHPMINRSRLRGELTKLHKEGYRTLNITGGAASGKTFSFQLVQALAELEGFPVLLVDVADWGSERFTALELVRRLSGHLKVEIAIDVVHGVPDPHTRARLLTSAVLDSFPKSRTTRWIVIDGLDRANVDADARALVEKLMQSIDVNGQPADVRLVVTGFTGTLPRQTCREDIAAISRADVRDLFEASVRHLGLAVDGAELEAWTDRAWDGYDPAVQDLTDLGELIYRIVRDEVRAVAR